MDYFFQVHIPGYSLSGMALKKGLKVVIGLVPVFILAGFLEGFVTRMTDMPVLFKIAIILGSAIFIFIYFIFIPLKIKLNGLHSKNSFLQNKELQSEA